MYAAAQDALKWLADNIPPSEGATINKYAVLRTQISMTRTDTTVELYFKNTVVNAMTSETLHKAQPAPVDNSFKSEFAAWMSTAQPGDIYERNIILTDAQHKWLVAVLSEMEGVEMDIEGGK